MSIDRGTDKDVVHIYNRSSSVHGIFQARVLEWIAISFSRGSSRPRDRTQVSHIVDRRFTIWATREFPYNRILLSHKKEQNWVICRDVYEPRICHTDWSQSEREKLISYINAHIQSLRYVCVSNSIVSDSVTPWTIACQASLSMGFPRQENQSELPFPSPGESSQPRDAIHVCCIGRRNLYHWGTREALAID